jgi:hypothetical protein
LEIVKKTKGYLVYEAPDSSSNMPVRNRNSDELYFRKSFVRELMFGIIKICLERLHFLPYSEQELSRVSDGAVLLSSQKSAKCGYLPGNIEKSSLKP